MNKQLVKQLYEKAENIAKMFSNYEREGNFNKETFFLHEIEPLSETTAAIIFKKSTKKLAIAFAYYISSQGGYWAYFFPKESHIHGMLKVSNYLHRVEKYNFKHNGCGGC